MSSVTAAAAVSDPRTKRIVLVASILGSGIVFLDGTIVNVALPAMRKDLHGGLAQQQWVVEAYLLTLSSLLLIGGSLGDLLGLRRIFSIGLTGFGVCSLLCALAPTNNFLIGARAVQGVFGALLVPSTLALIMQRFPEDERAPAIGSWTAWTAIATVIGPLGGGARRPCVRADRAADVRMDQPPRSSPADRRSDPVRRLPRMGAPLAAADDAAVPLPQAQLQHRQSDHPGAVRRSRRGDLLPGPVSPAGGRLHTDPGRPVAAANNGRDLPAIAAVRGARRPSPAALLHGRWTDRRRRGATAT